MLHVVELHIPDHADWGKTIARDVVLPNKINRIKSLFATAHLGKHTFIIPSMLPNVETGDKYHEFADGASPFDFDSCDTLIGTLSVSVNNADVIVPDMPIYAQAKMLTSVQRNRFELEKPMTIRKGSALRMIMEERLACPFYNKNLAIYGENVREAFMAFRHSSSMDVNSPMESEYTIKLFIEYD